MKANVDRIKRKGVWVVMMLLSLLVHAQGSVGSWRSHLAYHKATQCVTVRDKVYVLSDGSLYSYYPSDEFVETYDKSTLLSDQGIRHIAVDDQSDLLVVVYNNANIDILSPNGEVANITDFAAKGTLDPIVNDVRIVDGNAYLATNFGLTVLDVKRGEFINTYMLGKVTYSCVRLGGHLYAATAQGLYCGDTQDNLLEPSRWTLLNSSVYSQLSRFGDNLVGIRSDKSLYRIDTANGQPKLLRKGPFSFVHSVDGKLVVGSSSHAFVYETLDTSTQLDFDGTLTFLTLDGSTYWTCNGANGLNGYIFKETLVHTVGPIIPNSPIRNHCQYLHFVDDERLLIAGGCLNYFGTTLFDGTLMMYEDGEWSSFEEDSIALKTGVHYKNMTSIVQDPKDPNHHYASSFGQGIYEFRDMKFVRQYTHKEKPGFEHVVASPLESAVPTSSQYTRISRLLYDKQGNLWITNADDGNQVMSPLKVMLPNGTIKSLYYKELEKLATATEVLFDSRERVWVVNMRSDVRLFCIDMNGTLEDTSDDRIRTFNEKFIDQDGQSETINYLNDIAEDQNGNLWVLTDKGPYVLYDTDKVFDKDYHFTKIKVPRNDGTNYADYLLDGVYTTCMAVDAANRKWIGTLNNGLYLIGPEGLESIHHFTLDNSPLPSNVIESLVLHHASGELYIGTDKGLVSYVGDATRAEEVYSEEKVYAYPNPVHSHCDGPITVVGLKANSHVKIVNAAGRLVHEGTSLGGSFTWNGLTAYGQRVATGIYYVLGCDEDGVEGIVTKILFLK